MKKLTIPVLIERARQTHGDLYDYSLFTEYKDRNGNVPIICRKHGKFEQSVKNHINGAGCPQCAGNIKKTTEQFIQEAKEVHQELFDYSETDYLNNIDKVKIKCQKHGIFLQAPVEHLSGKGCKSCANDLYRKTIETFIMEASALHNNKYDYSEAKYVNWQTKVIIKCSKHGNFLQTPNAHLRGDGCPDCGRERVKRNTESFIAAAKLIHNDTYDYSGVEYIGSFTSVIIGCNKHGQFSQTPHHHLDGSKCPKCCIEDRTLTYEEFKTAANKAHNSKYTYEDQEAYTTTKEKTKIICPMHGEFNQTAGSHMTGVGCPSCGHCISKPETAWLDSLNIPKEQRQGRLIVNGRIIKPDAYDPATNTIYEFYGDFWHGNPKVYPAAELNSSVKQTFGDLYKSTLEREEMLKEAGYNVISTWESDFVSSITTNPVS